ncbi:PR domain zinc finger protein 2 isoform X2 [Clarias gariepinus]|nr:PR domain zinc finger protein 2 isoform X2 [Clarias gariepinus]
MRDSDKGITTEQERPSVSSDPSHETGASRISATETRDVSLSCVSTAVLEVKESEKSDEGELQPDGSLEHSAASQSGNRSEQPDPKPIIVHSVKEGSESPLHEVASVCSLVSPERDAEGDPEFEDDAKDGNYHCQYCECQFSTKHSLEHHISTHNIRNHQTLTFKCRYCAKPFGSQVGKRRHEKRHENGSKGLKRPGSLAGTAFLRDLSGGTESPISGGVTSSSPTITSSQNNTPHLSSEALTKDAGVEPDPSHVLEENGESKELHPCKYCNKAFGTHTNMRRHQRRIHERHLMPKGVRRKGILLQAVTSQQLQQGQSSVLQEPSPHNSPPLIYVPSVDTDDEVEREDSMVDVSKNISENLSLYIDGKILSTSTVSSCEVIEVDSSSPALFGLDAVILSTTQISQALQLETQQCHPKGPSVIDQSVAKRRTSTPPLLPTVKTEPDNMSSAESSSSTSSQSSSMGGNTFPQQTETLAFQKEKTVYLSPKLKQLLQTQDSQKPTLALITDSCKLTTPLSVSSLPAAQGRFKRRTASPPTHVQSSSSPSVESPVNETQDSFAVSKVESDCITYSWNVSSKEQRDCKSPSGKVCPVLVSGGSSCNQQPLDLSGAIGKNGGSISKGPIESVLDLSTHHKSVTDHKTKTNILLHSHVKRKKPNTSMLEKVLMNEYSSLSSAGGEGSPRLGSPDTHLSSGSTTGVSPSSVCSNSEHPPRESVSPPSLTPVTIIPSSPSSSSQASSTPPPPVLPTVPSPPPLSQFSDTAFPKLSPKPFYPTVDEMSEFPNVKEACLELKNSDDKDIYHTAEQLITTTDALSQSSEDRKNNCNVESFSKSETLLKCSTSDPELHLLKSTKDYISLHERNTDSEAIQNSSFDRTSPQGLQSSHSPVHFAQTMDSPSSYQNIFSTDSNMQSLVDDGLVKHLVEDADGSTINDDDDDDDDGDDSSFRVPEKTLDGGDALELDMFTKSFVCNVCEEPFHSIKQLSNHIVSHAVEWPFKCEFCVQLFQNAASLLEHRSSLHGVGRIYCCSICAKEFAFLCNLQQHQSDLHPGQSLAHTMVENGKLRPQNYTDPTQVTMERNSSSSTPDTIVDVSSQDSCKLLNCSSDNEEADGEEQEDPTEELYTTIKIMASEAGKPKCPDVRLGINQHYPSFKPPPFPYHNRATAGSVASATNFTTHNIPQTFSTAIRCTKCGNSFDNMPELHKHILACANASDKRRYTPKKNPVPLRQTVTQPQNGIVLPITAAVGGQNAFRRMGQPKRLNFVQEVPAKIKISALNKKKNQLVQKAISQKKKAANSVKKASILGEEQEIQACPYCNREFTYAASLAKHTAWSCPQKPAAKKKKGALMSQDKNMKLRSRVADSEIKQEGNPGLAVKPLGKIRTRSSELSEVDVPVKNGKSGNPQKAGKRLALEKDHSGPKSKKGRKSKLQTSVLSSSQPPAKMQHSWKDIGVKKEGERNPQLHLKKEKHFTKRRRERVGGPVTRSLQMSNTSPPGEVKTEDPPTN